MLPNLTNGEDMFRHEVDRVIGSIDRRLAEQREHIEALKAAHKPVRAAQARLRMLDQCRGRLLALSTSFGPDAPQRNHRH
jgi:hypothetical protein